MQDVYVIAVPTIVIFPGILLNRSDIRELRSEIRTVGDELGKKIDALRDDPRQFDRTIGQHDARMDSIENKIASIPPASGMQNPA